MVVCNIKVQIIIQVGFKGFQIDPSQQKATIPFSYEGEEYKLMHGKRNTTTGLSDVWGFSDVFTMGLVFIFSLL